MTEETSAPWVNESQDALKPRYPPAAGDYVRSPALQNQLEMLQSNNAVDYFLECPVHAAGAHTVQFDNQLHKRLFEIYVGQAVMTGDPRGIQALYEVLKKAVKGVDCIGVNGLKRQMKHEFSYIVDDN